MSNDVIYDAPVGTTFREADDATLLKAFCEWWQLRLQRNETQFAFPTATTDVAAFLAARREERL